MAEQADALKQRGNAALAKGDMRAANDLYSQAIALTPDNHVLYSNRAGPGKSLARLRHTH